MLKLRRSLILISLFMSGCFIALSGQDLDSLLQASMEEKTEYTTATFKATRILNGHSIERMTEGEMDFRISHRFGTINSGAYEFFGLDQAHIHLSLEYGITDWIMVGLGRGTFEKTIDGFTKLSLFRQSSGLKEMPVSVSYMAGIYVNGLKWDDPELDHPFYQRLSYAHQIMIGRKFSPGFSLQLTPSYLHRNLVETAADPNDLFAIGAGARLKLSNRISVNAEYFYLFKPDNETLSTAIYNPFSLGIDIETGGHVFQIIMTNSVGMRENAFLGHTTGQWLEGDIHLGFNISRVFQLKIKEEVMRKGTFTAMIILAMAGSSLGQGKYLTNEGTIIFYSHTIIEDITAVNKDVASVIDAQNGDISVIVQMTAFEFEKKKMQEHFNENYVESEKFPKATFSGSIINNQDVDYSAIGIYEVEVEGEMSIHGVTNRVSAEGSLEVTKEGIRARTTFLLNPQDYDIKIPAVVRNNIAENMEIRVDLLHKPI